MAECDGVGWGDGVAEGVEKPDRESFGLALPGADLPRGLRAREGNELEGTCQPPSPA